MAFGSVPGGTLDACGLQGLAGQETLVRENAGGCVCERDNGFVGSRGGAVRARLSALSTPSKMPARMVRGLDAEKFMRGSTDDCRKDFGYE